MKNMLVNEYYRDVFLSHANVDKDEFVMPFVKLLEEREISYWLDEAEIHWGSSLLTQLSEGLVKSRYTIVFITDTFLSRNWPQAELRTVLNEEISTGKLRVLPILICDEEKCLNIHPFLRDKKYLKWNNNIENIVEQLEKTLGRQYACKWSFKYPAEYRGHIWIKIIPKLENKNKLHEFIINWGRWKFSGILNFNCDKAAILDFNKIAENKSWPIFFKINPSAFITSGKGNPIFNINNGWKCIDKKGLSKALLSRGVQFFLPDTDESSAKLITNVKINKKPSQP